MILSLDRRQYAPHLTWRPSFGRVVALIALGLPMAMTACADLGAAALFQLMQVQVGVVDGAATQIVTIFTAIAYMPGIGLALAGTTLVGQAIGAGDRAWAERLGNRIIAVVACYMGGVGLVIALTGNWLVPLFVNAERSARGRGDRTVRVAAVARGRLPVLRRRQFRERFLPARRGRCAGAGTHRAGLRHVDLPAADARADFRAGRRLVRRPAPGFGLGAVGGWSAILVYVLAIGTSLWLRWRNGAWKRIRL